jgi:hypothetical protein
MWLELVLGVEMKKSILVVALFFLNIQGAHGASCPGDVVIPYEGQWQGQALLVPSQGPSQVQPGTRDEFKRINCNSFQVSIDYLDNTGKSVRQVIFSAEATSQEAQLFKIEGTVTEGGNVSPMKGFMHIIESGTMLATFESAFTGKIAYFTELINISTKPEGGQLLTRTIQMFAGQKGGPYIGSRIMKEERISK